MDAEKLGAFIAACRKEKGMKQAELAVKINVTDKAVSRWERGIGFPDINTLEPLADALGVSILELMKAERFPTEQTTVEEASEAIKDTLCAVKEQRKKERRDILAIGGSLAALTVLILFLDGLHWRVERILYTAAGVGLPLFCIVGFPVLLGCAVWKKATGRSGGQTLAAALTLLGILVLLLGAFVLIGALGIGPVPE